jgi:MFS transporter, ACS family, pantothenate transporter
LVIPATANFVGMIVVVAYPSLGAVFFGYIINAASWGYWPVLYAWCNEICHADAEERAVVIGVAQTFGQAFVAWVPVLILDVGKYAPRFHLGFCVLSGISVCQFAMIFVLRWFVKHDPQRGRAAKTTTDDTVAAEFDEAEASTSATLKSFG